MQWAKDPYGRRWHVVEAGRALCGRLADGEWKVAGDRALGLSTVCRPCLKLREGRGLRCRACECMVLWPCKRHRREVKWAVIGPDVDYAQCACCAGEGIK